MIWEWAKFIFVVCYMPFFVLFALLLTLLQAAFEMLLAFLTCYSWREFFDCVADVTKILKKDFNQLRNSK